MNESLAKETWELFVEQTVNHNKVGEWLNAMGECLFGEDDEEKTNDFLSQKRKADLEKENNRKLALRNQR